MLQRRKKEIWARFTMAEMEMGLPQPEERIQSPMEYDPFACEKCNDTMLLGDEGFLICGSCGQMKTHYDSNQVITHDRLAYTVPANHYKRVTHFKEILTNFQGLQNHKFKPNFLKNINDKIRVDDIPIETLGYVEMRDIMKSLGYKKYYEHIFLVLKHLGKPTASFDFHDVEKMLHMFSLLHEPYSRYNNSPRVHFINYYYVLLQFLRILDKYHEFWDKIPLLKNKHKTDVQNRLWRQICDHLGWAFYPVL